MKLGSFLYDYHFEEMNYLDVLSIDLYTLIGNHNDFSLLFEQIEM